MPLALCAKRANQPWPRRRMSTDPASATRPRSSTITRSASSGRERTAVRLGRGGLLQAHGARHRRQVLLQCVGEATQLGDGIQQAIEVGDTNMTTSLGVRACSRTCHPPYANTSAGARRSLGDDARGRARRDAATARAPLSECIERRPTAVLRGLEHLARAGRPSHLCGSFSILRNERATCPR